VTTPAATSGGTAELDPRDHCDRVGEQAIFRELMGFKSTARLMTISDIGRSGKSSLLRRLQHNCREELKPSVPSSLVELNLLGQTEESALAQTPFAFVRSVIYAFKHRVDTPQALFPAFHALKDAVEKALESTAAEENPLSATHDDAQVAPPGSPGSGIASAKVNEGQVIGIKKVDKEIRANVVIIQNGRPGLTPDQEQRIHEQYIEAFFADLRATSAQRPLTILLDGWDQCNRDLRDWIHDELLGRNLFHPDHAQRPSQLLVVIAGRPHGYKDGEHPRGLRSDEFASLFDSHDEFAQAVYRIEGLSREWDDGTIQSFVRILGYPPLDAVELSFIRDKMYNKGWTPGKLKTVVQSWYESEAL
jgi:hypothetical protein